MVEKQKENDYDNPVAITISAEQILDMLETNLNITKKYFRYEGLKKKEADEEIFKIARWVTEQQLGFMR